LFVVVYLGLGLGWKRVRLAYYCRTQVHKTYMGLSTGSSVRNAQVVYPWFFAARLHRFGFRLG